MIHANADEEAGLLHEPLSDAEVRAYEERLRRLLASLQEEVGASEDGALARSGAERRAQDDERAEATALHAETEVEDDLGYAVREALERIRAGTYGICASCGEWIARERLALVPETRRCGPCAVRAAS